jgi:ribosome-associated protein
MIEPTADTEPQPEPSKICLDDYLKACGIVETGGQAKVIIQSGRVKLNGIVETRRRKKLVPGDVIQIDDEESILVESDEDEPS